VEDPRAPSRSSRVADASPEDGLRGWTRRSPRRWLGGDRAARAQRGPAQRYDGMIAHADELAELMTLETGKRWRSRAARSSTAADYLLCTPRRRCAATGRIVSGLTAPRR